VSCGARCSHHSVLAGTRDCSACQLRPWGGSGYAVRVFRPLPRASRRMGGRTGCETSAMDTSRSIREVRIQIASVWGRWPQTLTRASAGNPRCTFPQATRGAHLGTASATTRTRCVPPVRPAARGAGDSASVHPRREASAGRSCAMRCSGRAPATLPLCCTLQHGRLHPSILCCASPPTHQRALVCSALCCCQADPRPLSVRAA
jgi:hypothetical protein